MNNTYARNALLAIAFVAVIGIGTGAYFQFRPGEAQTTDTGQVAGAVDYSAIPDGTPETAEVRLNEEKTIMGARITALEVLEDSRCPADVQCIQAGTVRVRTSIMARGDTAAQEAQFELGVPMTFGLDQVTLVAVSPAASAGSQIAPGDYVFTFTVVKGGGTEFFKG
jgi:hypothetical protein